MIKRAKDMTANIREHMRDGDGKVVITNILDKGEYNGKTRMLAKITLNPGCSIGYHVHENEEEIFYIIKGTAAYNDNGTEVTLNTGDSSICTSGHGHAIANKTDGTVEIMAAILLY